MTACGKCGAIFGSGIGCQNCMPVLRGVDEQVGHHCHARGCTTPCVAERLFCPSHWFMVPRSIQADVWKHYRDGQCQDMNPSKEWHAAADAAIGFVAMKE